MSDVAYIMETQDPKELWLIEGENRFRVSRDMYFLLVSNGADLPPTYDIADVMEENAKLRKLAGVMSYCMQAERDCDGCKMNGAAGTVTEPAGCGGLLDLLRELGVIQNECSHDGLRAWDDVR